MGETTKSLSNTYQCINMLTGFHMMNKKNTRHYWIRSNNFPYVWGEFRIKEYSNEICSSSLR